MRRILFSLITLLFWGGLMYAENAVTVSVSDGVPGDTVTVQVAISATDRVVAAEFVIPEPEGLSFVTGSFVAQETGMSSSSVFADGELRAYFYSKELEGSELANGNLFTFKVKLGRNPGAFRIQPSVVLSDVNANPLNVRVTGSDITVKAPQIGFSSNMVDFGHIAIRSTYTRTLRIANTGTIPLNVYSITGSSAEVTVSETSFSVQPGATKDLIVSYTPLTKGEQNLTLTIVSDAIDNTSSTVAVVSDAYSVNELKVGNTVGESDSVITVDLYMDNMEDIAALECSFVLPDGLSYVDGSFTASDRLQGMKSFPTVENGVLKLYVYSESGETIKEGSGQIFSIKLYLGCTNGTYSLVPEDVILGNRDLVNVLSAVYEGSVEIMSPVIDCSPVLNMGSNPMTETAAGIFRIQNKGKKDLIIERIAFDDTVFSSKEVFPVVIGPGSEKGIEICYQPTAPGDYTSIMRVYTNVPDNRIIDIDITGSTFEPNYITSEIKLNSDKKSGTMTVSMSNYNNITAIQLNVYGLEDLTVDKQSLSLKQRCSGLSSVMTFNDDGSVKVFIYSLDNKIISGNRGDLFSFTFSGNKLLDGDLEVRITDIVLSDENGKNISSSDTMATGIDDSLCQTGDANGDGKIDVADITSVVNYIYGQPADDFNINNADVNANGIINVTDISGIVSIIAGMNN